MAPVDILRTALVGAALANGTAAMAWVKMCNGRSDTVMAAFALADKGAPGSSVSHPGVTVEGWWKLAPGECATVSEADARQGFLYFHATSSAGRLEGKSRLCVRNKPFTSQQQFLLSQEHCKGPWSEAGFLLRETSAKNFNYTVR